MTRREKVEALILSRKSVGEADRLLMLFTRSCGLRKVVAKGVRKIPSRRGGHVEPFTAVLALVSGGHDGWYLSAVETTDYFSALQANQASLMFAQNLAGVVIHLFEEEEAQPRLFDALYHAWAILPALSWPRAAVLETSISLFALRCAGLVPNLATCQVCGIRQPNEAVILDATAGGWHCLLCHHGLSGTRHSLSPRLFQVVRYLSAYPEQATRFNLTRDESWQLLNSMRAYMAAAIGQPAAAYIKQ